MLSQFKNILKSQLGADESYNTEPPLVLQCSLTCVNIDSRYLASEMLKFENN